jgi:tRNA(adenine34) deaminase
MNTELLNSTNHPAYMLRALELAQQAAQAGEVPIGAVIVHDNKIIAEGYNKTEQKQCALYHAEIEAIDKASAALGTRRLNDCILYTTLEPCPMCAGAIVQARIPYVVLAASDPKGGYAGSLYNLLQDERLNHQCMILRGILENESSQLLKDFFLTLRTGIRKRSAEKFMNYPGNTEA